MFGTLFSFLNAYNKCQATIGKKKIFKIALLDIARVSTAGYLGDVRGGVKRQLHCLISQSQTGEKVSRLTRLHISSRKSKEVQCRRTGLLQLY